MKVILMSGALKNAGDFLITKRSEALLRDYDQKLEISVLIRNYAFNGEQINEINKSDLILVAGGPYYVRDLSPRVLPFTQDLNNIIPRIGVIGGGWYENSCENFVMNHYKFSEKTIQFLQRVEKDTGYLGCRDNYSVRVLANNDIYSGLMTGCPAWYDIESIDKRIQGKGDIRKIAISDPSDVLSYGKQSVMLVKFLKEKYPEAEINYIFHRGIESDNYTGSIVAKANVDLQQKLEAIGVKIHDIAYGYEGFEIYDECDIHIGYRVHAHIYNLSRRNKTILIEEDVRGAGINDALGLWRIKAYQKKRKIAYSTGGKIYNKVYDHFETNKSLIEEVNTYIQYLNSNDYLLFNEAFGRMENYYLNMQRHIKMMLNKDS